MSKIISFLSGKGGSGKTTLALSISDLISKCGMKVLLIDSDLSTNGATYFYEDKLFSSKMNSGLTVTSFDNILNQQNPSSNYTPFKISSKIDFIPSIVDFSSHVDSNLEVDYSDLDNNLTSFVKWAEQSYDVILFDCQAGYTKLLPFLLPFMDVDLFVLEADSISASAMRNLHLKIGNYFGNAHLYQVFNKVTAEEFEIYSKIVGTFFTNIGTLLFDWKIRQAFSRSQVPNLDSISSKYSFDLCDICQIMFPDEIFKKKLSDFSNRVKYQSLKDKRFQTEQELIKYEKEHRSSRSYMIVGSTIFFAVILCFLFFILDSSINNTNSEYLNVELALLSSLVFIFVLMIALFMTRNSMNVRRTFEKQLKYIDNEIKKLEELIN